MKERCERQHRMGETCGKKLVHSDYVTMSPEPCRVCKDIDIKSRKLDKERQNIARWRQEGKKFVASIEKAENEVERLKETIDNLESSRVSKKFSLSSASRHTGMQPSKRLTSRATELLTSSQALMCSRTSRRHIMWTR